MPGGNETEKDEYKITIDLPETMIVGQKYTIEPTTKNDEEDTYEYEVSDSEIVELVENELTILKEGTFTLTIKSANHDQKYCDRDYIIERSLEVKSLQLVLIVNSVEPVLRPVITRVPRFVMLITSVFDKEKLYAGLVTFLITGLSSYSSPTLISITSCSFLF